MLKLKIKQNIIIIPEQPVQKRHIINYLLYYWDFHKMKVEAFLLADPQ